ncbi:MAG: YitT family protein [Clostridiales bacterium]|nr:YitT family protein [Clostridiales bacterium]
MKNHLKILLEYASIISLAILLAINYHFFIIENDFAPAGINGIATMIQYKTGFSISYFSLIINVPLCIFAYFFISKKYGVRSLVFTLVYSFVYLLLQQFDIDHLKYDAQGHDTIFPVIISGVLSSFVCGICFKNETSSGGTETVSKYISKIKPDFNFFIVTFTINALVAFASLFVYSEKGVINYKPVALCICYCFITYFVGNIIIKGTKNACKFTVITPYPDDIIKEITTTLKHSATKILVRGGYTNEEKTLLLCVVNKHQINDFKKIVEKYPSTFSCSETVNETYGNFKQIK